MRISGGICKEILQRYGGRKIDHIFFTGHSLGGAVAAIVGRFMDFAPDG
jgi:putative lipase involved disintegration of autophagic bodies